jgi:CheY-like chemotaxis protein
LQGEGFEVETVSNGVAAIKKLSKMQPVLVLADVSMPGKDGYEVCDYVKTSADLHHVPVLLVASDLEPYDELRGAQVGADGIIMKPFPPHDLIAMVAKFVALGEAQASPPALAKTLITSSPLAPPEVPSMGSEPGSATGRHEPLLVTTEPPPRLAPEEMTEPVPEPRLEVATEPTPAPPESTPEPIPEAAPESVMVSPESIFGTALEATSEPAPVVSEPPVAESGAPCAPVSETETVYPAAQAAPEAPPAVPAEEPLLPVVELQQPKPMAATSLDSFSLAEAAEGQVYIAPPEAEADAAPSPEAGVVEPGESPEPPPSVINPEWVRIIVRKVVTKMAPPVLSPDLVGELIRVLTEEITTELNSESSQRF